MDNNEKGLLPVLTWAYDAYCKSNYLNGWIYRNILQETAKRIGQTETTEAETQPLITFLNKVGERHRLLKGILCLRFFGGNVRQKIGRESASIDMTMYCYEHLFAAMYFKSEWKAAFLQLLEFLPKIEDDLAAARMASFLRRLQKINPALHAECKQAMK